MGQNNGKSQRPYRAPLVNTINSVGKFFQRHGFDRPLAVDAILRKACRKAGVRTWTDDSIREPLGVLVESLETDANLHPVGRSLLFHTLVHFAANRIRIQQSLDKDPSPLDRPIRRPLYVVGLPRTGTTLLYNLLCQDSRARPLYTWESFWPAARTRPDGKPPLLPLWRTRFMVRGSNHLAPDLKSVHPLEADGPEECTWLLANTFVSPAFMLLGKVPQYEQWLRDADESTLIAAYEYYRKELQMLSQQTADEHWILKSPAHMPSLNALLSVFTDACVVHTHRDLRSVVPSSCSLWSVVRGVYSDDVDPHALGAELVDSLPVSIERAAIARENHPDRVLDVTYDSVMADPVGTVKRIYERFGYTYDQGMEQRINAWLAEHPQHKHGVHRYNLEQYGLTEEMLEENFGSYQSQFEHAKA